MQQIFLLLFINIAFQSCEINYKESYFQVAASSYAKFQESNPTPSSSYATTYKFDHEFFVGDPAKCEQPGSERVITTDAVFLEGEDYDTAEDVTVD